jgi:adenosylcobinamide-GDP ribazoletransferase
MSVFNDIKVSFAFLTRIPIKHSSQVRLHESAVWFPLVGFFIGSASGAAYYFLAQVIPNLPAAALALLVSILITGAFHQDGLGDIFDGLVGGWNPEDRLRILKDSRHGTYGVVAICLQLILQVTLISSFDYKDGALVLLASHTVSKIVPVFMMIIPSAPNQAGMGVTAAREIKVRHLISVLILSSVLTIPYTGTLYLLILASLLIPTLVFSRWVYRKIGGILGDALGAGEQIAESTILTLFLFILSINGSIPWLI